MTLARGKTMGEAIFDNIKFHWLFGCVVQALLTKCVREVPNQKTVSQTATADVEKVELS